MGRETLGQRPLVGDHDDGHTELILKFAEQGEDRDAGIRVEMSRWFVGEQDTRAIDESAGDRDALLFATRKLSGTMAGAVAQLDAIEGFANALLALGTVHLGEAEGKLDVFFEGHARKELKGLKDDANGAAAVLGQRKRRQRGQIAAVNLDCTGTGAVQSRDEIEQRGLAGAGAAQQGEEGALGNFKTNAIERTDGGRAHGVVTDNVLEMNRRVGGHEGLRCLSQSTTRRRG